MDHKRELEIDANIEEPIWLIDPIRPKESVVCYETLALVAQDLEWMNPSDQFPYASNVNLGRMILVDNLGRRVFLRIEDSELYEARLFQDVADDQDLAKLGIAKASKRVFYSPSSPSPYVDSSGNPIPTLSSRIRNLYVKLAKKLKGG